MNKKTKIFGDYTDVEDFIDRNIIKPLGKLPSKIDAIKSGKTNIPFNSNMQIIPCIVTYEPLYSSQMFREIIDKRLESDGITPYYFELMSIEDLEWLLSWSKYESPEVFLSEKYENPDLKYMSVRKVIEIKIPDNGKIFIIHKFHLAK